MERGVFVRFRSHNPVRASPALIHQHIGFHISEGGDKKADVRTCHKGGGAWWRYMFLELACVKFIPHVTRGDGEREGRQEERGGRRREVMEGGWLARGGRGPPPREIMGMIIKRGENPSEGELSGRSHTHVTARRGHEDGALRLPAAQSRSVPRAARLCSDCRRQGCRGAAQTTA